MRWLLGAAAAAAIAAVLLWIGLVPPRLEQPPRAELVISGVTVINPGVERLADRTLVVRDGRIAEVRPRLASDPAPVCADCFALPGLIDAHVHTPPRIALGNQRLFSLLHLAHGVTTVRDLGESEPSVGALASRLNSGAEVGPRMLRCGPVLDGEPPGWPMAETITTAEQATATVARLARDGVDCIKVYNEIGREAFEAVAGAAARHGLPLIGHVPHAVGLAGVSDFEAQHVTGIPYVSRPRPPIGWDFRSEDLSALLGAEIDAAVELAAARRVAFTPTLANHSLRLIASDPVRFRPTPASRWLPAYWRHAWNFVAPHPEGDMEIAVHLEARPTLYEIARRLHRRGVDVLAGTDTIMPWVVPGEALHLELAALAEAFGGAEPALAAATTVNGRHLAPGEIGVIEPGARADVLLLRSDPTRDLAALRDWSVLIADGRRYERALVDGWLERYQRHFHGPLYATVMGGVVSTVSRRFDNIHAR